MRYAIISDVHANLPSLEAVLADVNSRTDITATYHLGDLVGYSPWPNEVIDTIRKAGIHGVAGNYDSTVAADYKHCGCRADTPRDEELAHISYEWTRANVSAESKQWLGGLPFRIELKPLGGHVAGPTITLVHATPTNNLVYVTEDRSDSFLSKMAQQAGLKSGDAMCFGHTHKPWHRVVDGVTFVNTGSVGRPKDGDPRAGYVVLQVVDGSIAVDSIRVAYDLEKAATAVVEVGLPVEMADFLRAGGGK